MASPALDNYDISTYGDISWSWNFSPQQLLSRKPFLNGRPWWLSTQLPWSHQWVIFSLKIGTSSNVFNTCSYPRGSYSMHDHATVKKRKQKSSSNFILISYFVSCEFLTLNEKMMERQTLFRRNLQKTQTSQVCHSNS